MPGISNQDFSQGGLLRSALIFIIILLLLFSMSGLEAANHKKVKRTAARQKKFNLILKKTISAYNGLNESAVGWRVLGYSVRKRPIYYREFGSGKRTLLLIGGMHGDEPAATLSVIKFGEYLHAAPGLATGRVVLIPCINPDGLFRGTRVNANGVDINRNFPSDTWSQDYVKSYNYPGRLPASEPETVIIINAIYDFRPWMAIQVHQPFGALYPSSGVTPMLYENMSALSGLPVEFDIGYNTPGSFGSYLSREDLAIPCVTFELGSIYIEPDYGRINLSFLEAVNYVR